MELEDLVGKRLVIGVPGTKITPEIVKHFKETHAGGLILYRINFESPLQLKKLISDLEEALEKRLLVMADHEGGRVVMFGEGVTVFPDNLALGMADNRGYVEKQGAIEGKELRRLGLDVNLAPVLDVLTGDYSPNIGIRSYGKDWRKVAEMGVARIQAIQSQSLSACAKHFPGKGHAPVDAHLKLPVILSTWQEMESVHIQPFRKAIEAEVDMIMSSHPYYPKLDSEPNRIATFSKKIIGDYLREHLGFKGVISSDDLEMGAIREICPIGEAAVQAAAAGHDILLVCHDLNSQKEAYQHLIQAYREKRLSIPELEKSVERIEKLQSKRKNRFSGESPHPELEGAEIVQRICRESVRVLQNWNEDVTPHPNPLPEGEGIGLIPPSARNGKVGVIFPKISSLASKIMVEEAMLSEEKFLLGEFEKYGVRPDIHVVSIEPTPQEITETIQAVQGAESLLFFCFDAHLYPSNKTLLDQVQSSGKKVVVILLRDPYDIEFVKVENLCLTDFGWRNCQIKENIRKICASK